MRLPLAADMTGRVAWLVLGLLPDGRFREEDDREALVEIADAICAV